MPMREGMLTLGAGGTASGVMIDLLIILATAAMVSLVFRRLKVATIPGYLIAGAIFGPNAIGLVRDSESVASISQVAIILLMFGIGMHLDRRDLKSGFVPILAVGLISTLLSVILITPLAMAFGLNASPAIAVAIALAMSSTAVVLRILQQRRELRQLHGRIEFGTLLAQDLAVVGALAMMPLLASLGGVESAEPSSSPSVIGMIAGALVTIGAIGLMIAIGNYALPRVLAEAARDTSQELLLVSASAIGLGAAVLTGALGLSPELGAFLAGFMLAGTPFRHQLSGMMGPMRDLFMAVFFTAVGLGLNVVVMFELWWVVLIGVVAVVLLKTLSIGLTAWFFGTPPVVAVVVGLSLAQAGEFSLVIAGVAQAQGLFGDDAERVTAVLISIVFVSLLITPNLIAWSRPLAHRFGKLPRSPFGHRAIGRQQHTPVEDTPRKTVVIAGFGPVGRVVADKLSSAGYEITIVEINPETVRKQSSIGRNVVFGDITNPEVLSSAGVTSADAVLLTMPDDEAMLRATRTIREQNQTAFIAARTHYLSGAFLAKEVGANTVTVEELATAEAMIKQVQEFLGSPRADGSKQDRAPEPDAEDPTKGHAASSPASS